LQGSEGVFLRCGWIFKCEFVSNLPLSLLAKEFSELVNIWGSYGQELCLVFFTHGVDWLQLIFGHIAI